MKRKTARIAADTKIEDIKKTVREIMPNSYVVLFGSRANNTNRPDSDYDLLVIIEDDLPPKEKMQYRTKIRIALHEYDVYADVLMQSKKEANVKRKLVGHVIRTAMKEGVKL